MEQLAYMFLCLAGALYLIGWLIENYRPSSRNPPRR